MSPSRSPRELPASAREVIEALSLEPHPEGGFYRETWRGGPAGTAEPIQRGTAGRPAGTAIYFLLAAGEVSAWHRIDADEVWHFYVGDPLELRIASDDAGRESIVLGPEIASGERPQAVVPAGAWQSARTLGAWTLAGCTVAPGFVFERFELAPPGWTPA